MLISEKKLAQVSLAQAATEFTEAVKMTRFSGECSALVKIGGAGSVTITQQASVDGKTFYDLVDPDGTAVGEVANGATAGYTWRKWTVTAGMYIRFKCAEGNVGTATVDINLVYQESLE